MSEKKYYPIPYVGMTGSFTLSTPFTTSEGEFFTCTAIRRLSTYVAANEDVKATIYKDIPESEYESALKENIEIVTLTSDRGQNKEVPANYFEKFPDQDGIKYRRLDMVVSIPPVKVDQDFTQVFARVTSALLQTLGVKTNIRLVQSSKIAVVSPAQSANITDTRQEASSNGAILEVEVERLQTENASLRQKVAQLEKYIIDNAP